MRSHRFYVVRALAIGLALAGALLVPALSLAEVPDVGNTFETATPKTWSYEGTASIDPATDTDDVYKVWLTVGKRFEVGTESPSTGVDIDIFLSSAAATTTVLRGSGYTGSDEYFYYDVPRSGWYFVDVWAYDGSVPGYPTASTAGDYDIWFWQSAVPYKLQSFTAPKTARKYRWFNVSVLMSPTYLRTGRAVTFITQKRSGKWRTVLRYAAKGTRVAGNKSKFACREKLSRGTYRIKAEFKDVDHKLTKTVWKTVTVK